MKKKDVTLLRASVPQDLATKLKQHRERMRTLSFEYQAGKTQNIKEIKTLKKDIARILTFLKEKQENVKK